MDHPPIPKSEHFLNTQWPAFLVPQSASYGNTAIDMGLEMPGREWRKIIAAVAEVDWLKRAKRWDVLKGRILLRAVGDPEGERKWRWDGDFKKLLRFREASKRAEENAKAWREWGAQRG